MRFDAYSGVSFMTANLNHGQCSFRSCSQGGASTVDVEEKEHVHLYTANGMSVLLRVLSNTTPMEQKGSSRWNMLF